MENTIYLQQITSVLKRIKKKTEITKQIPQPNIYTF